MTKKFFYKTGGNTVSSVSTVVGITLVLVMVSVIVIVSQLGIALTDHYKGQAVIQLMLDTEISEDAVKKINTALRNEPFAAEVNYTTKEEAARIMQEELGEDFIGFLGYNPLPSSIDLKLHNDYNTTERVTEVVQKLEKLSGVNEIVYQKDLLEQMNSNLKKWRAGLMIIGVLLLAIAVVLIVNTIQLAIFSQRFLIKSMQLVGATHWFIQRPFMRRGLWYGFISGLLALVVTFLLMLAFRDEMGDIIRVLSEKNRLLILVFTVMAIGLLLSWIATIYAVRKFLYADTGKLY
jgi:cell division transport system permease protein